LKNVPKINLNLGLVSNPFALKGKMSVRKLVKSNLFPKKKFIILGASMFKNTFIKDSIGRKTFLV
jgi:hypothetical protein